MRVPVAALTRIAEVDGFRPAVRLGRREALWHLKGLADEGLPLFAAAEARSAPVVHRAYRRPVAFLRKDLTRRRIIPCADAMASRNRRRYEVAGIVLVRQRPGSAKEVMFITLEDESGIANLVVWPRSSRPTRSTILGAGIAVTGQVQPEGKVVHLVIHRSTDLSADLASIGRRVRRTGKLLEIRQPGHETFGENIGVLTYDTFGLTEPHRVCRRLIRVSYAAMGSFSRAA